MSETRPSPRRANRLIADRRFGDRSGQEAGALPRTNAQQPLSCGQGEGRGEGLELDLDSGSRLPPPASASTSGLTLRRPFDKVAVVRRPLGAGSGLVRVGDGPFARLTKRSRGCGRPVSTLTSSRMRAISLRGFATTWRGHRAGSSDTQRPGGAARMNATHPGRSFPRQTRDGLPGRVTTGRTPYTGGRNQVLNNPDTCGPVEGLLDRRSWREGS